MFKIMGKLGYNKYKNYTEYRSKNKRVVVQNIFDLSVGIRLDIMDEVGDKPRARHVFKRGRTTTLLKLTNESAKALFMCLGHELKLFNNEDV